MTEHFDLPSSSKKTADAPGRDEEARRVASTARDSEGQSIGTYSRMRSRQTPLPLDVKIYAHIRGPRAELNNITWPIADIRGLITWRLVKVTGEGKNDREPLDSRGFIGDGRRPGFDIALDALSQLRPEWSRPNGVMMPRRTEPPSSDAEKLVLEYRRRVNERGTVEARLRTAKEAAQADVEAVKADATARIAAAEAKAIEAVRAAQEAFAWNMHQITGLADALAVIGIDVAKL